MSNKLIAVKSLLFQIFSRHHNMIEPPAIFILGSPRTGSTLLYQIICKYFNVFWFSNFINSYFSKNPIWGAVLEAPLKTKQKININSLYGKTKGLFSPSEASKIFSNWFGGEQPSQVYSKYILSGKEDHIKNTFACIYELFEKPILTKNAWNCFRIDSLIQQFNNILFIWIRRDIYSSAISDLESRYKKGDPSLIWNSATIANYKIIKKMPYWEQVVEQQFEYNKIIRQDLNLFTSDKFIEIWYEDICAFTQNELKRIEKFFFKHQLDLPLRREPIQDLRTSAGPKGLIEDKKRIHDYIKENKERFAPYRYIKPKKRKEKNQ